MNQWNRIKDGAVDHVIIKAISPPLRAACNPNIRAGVFDVKAPSGKKCKACEGLAREG